jgi:hypothetical protein
MIIGINGYAGSGKDTIGIIIQFLNSYRTANVTIEELVTFYHTQHEWWLEEQSGWEIKKWAGKLKDIASMLTGISQEKFEDQEFKKTYLPEQWNYWTVSVISDGNKLLFQQGRFTTKAEADGYIPLLQQNYEGLPLEYVVGMQQMTVRQFLQELGTDACRNGLHPNTWVNALMADYKHEPTGTVYNNQGGQVLEMPNWIITDTRFPNEAQAIKDAGGIIIRVDRPGVKAINAHPSETGLDDWDFDHRIMNGSDLVSLMFTVQTILKKHNLTDADYQTSN